MYRDILAYLKAQRVNFDHFNRKMNLFQYIQFVKYFDIETCNLLASPRQRMAFGKEKYCRILFNHPKWAYVVTFR